MDIVHPGTMSVQVERMIAVVQIILYQFPIRLFDGEERRNVGTYDGEIEDGDVIFRDHELIALRSDSSTLRSERARIADS